VPDIGRMIFEFSRVGEGNIEILFTGDSIMRMEEEEIFSNKLGDTSEHFFRNLSGAS